MNEGLKRQRMKRLIDDIFSTEANEIQCEEAGVLMGRCAAAGLNEAEAQRDYPPLWRHFQVCPDCAEEYEMLMTLARLAAAGQLAQPTQVPPVPERSSFLDRMAGALRIKFPGFAAELAAAVRRGVHLGIEPVTVSVEPEGLWLEFEVTVSETDARLRDLFCTVSTAEAVLEGTSIWLQVSDQAAVVQEAALNEFGDVTFMNLTPGPYDLGLEVSGREIVVQGIVLP